MYTVFCGRVCCNFSKLSDADYFARKNGTVVFGIARTENDNTLLLDEDYTTKAEAFKAVKAFKKNYNGKGKLECYVRYFDYQNGNIQDFNL